MMKNKTIRRKRLFSFFVLSVFVLMLLFFFRENVLTGAGNLLAPEGNGKADAVILEGTELIKLNVVEIGMGILLSGRANCLVVVVHQQPENRKNFALPDYPLLVAKNLEDLGLKENQFQVITVSINRPITLIEGKNVLRSLSKRGVKRAILVAQGFHTRRSYWSYKQEGLPLGIRIIPHPYFINYPREKWWQKIEGVDEFSQEFLKLIYYFFRGYISMKSLLVS